MKLVCCPLVSKEIEKAKRCVISCKNQFPLEKFEYETVAIINSKDEKFVSDFKDWCEQNKITYVITESNGTASKGKNEVLKFFKQSEFDGLCMLDGDDLWYPSGVKQVENHLLHHPLTDVLIVRPSDQISRDLNQFEKKIKNYSYALWETNFVCMNYQYGPGIHDIFTKGHDSASNLGGHAYYSKKLCNFVSYDEEQIIGEDFLLEFMMLKLHQERKISFWTSFASDVQFLDRTSLESIQNTHNQALGLKMFQRLKDIVRFHLPLERTSFNELPVEFPEMIFNAEKKFNWMKETFNL